LCIKVLRTDPERTVRLSQSSTWKTKFGRVYDNNQHEKIELDKLFGKHGNVIKQHFPQHYGFVETDLGNGLVLDLMRDFDGEISMSLREWISTGNSIVDIEPAFLEFGRFMYEHSILTKDILDHNIVVVRESEQDFRLVMIDGIGYSAFIPVAAWVAAVSRRRIKKKLEKAWARLEWLQESGGISADLVNNSSWGQGFRYNHSINKRIKED